MKIQEMFLTPNKHSRPQIPLTKVTKVAVHYTGNAGSSALATRNYFENCKYGGRYVSSHFVVGLNGEVIQCIPLNEWSYCTNEANGYSISIETCHPKSDGIFNDSTYISLCELCAMLLKKYELTTNDLIRHYDVTQKQCPLHWVPTKYQSKAVATARWNRFKQDVQTVMNNGKVTRNNTADITESNINNNKNTSASENSINKAPYIIRVIDDSLNVRKGAGLNYAVTAVIKKGEAYTIIEEKTITNKDGSKSVWGLLKSRIGWINVGKKYVEKIK